MNRLAKLFVLLFIALAVTGPVHANDLLSDSYESSGMGGFGIKWAPVKGQSLGMVGINGAWVIGRQFFIGAEGYVSVIRPNSNVFSSSNSGDFDFSYGGLWVGYIFDPDALWHLKLHTTIGGGSATVNKDQANSASAGFFILTPTVEYEINFSEFLRGGIGLSYQYVSGLSLSTISSGDLNTVTLNLGLSFGS